MDAPASRPLPPRRRLRMLARTLRAGLGRARALTRPALHAANLPAFRGRLELVRDRRGVAHVYAEHEPDLHAALGYLQAADRFVLLDLVRHLGAGRICQLVGNVRGPRRNPLLSGRRLAELDGFVRPLGFEAEAQRDLARLAPRARSCLDAFAEGVNAGLRAMRGAYPAEYLLLGPVRPWQAADSLLVARTSGFVVSLVNLENELGFDAVRARAGDALARRLYPDAPWSEAPAGVPDRGDVPPEPLVPVPTAGSNNWAVAASRSASGAPLLANDPHVPLFPLPTYWHHVHLECPDYRVQGGVFPGCPVFGFGHNGHLAWGCTTGFRDGWDLYRVHRLPDDPGRYRTAEGSAPLERHREVLPARFGREAVLEWERCEHGILYPGWTHHDGTELAVRFVSADLARWLEGGLELAAATTVEAHRRALESMHEGPFDFNHVYAHKDGHIGWELFGRLPRRASDGLFVRDAHDPAGRWQGFVPFAEMPKRLNPECGYVASANSTVDPEAAALVATLAHYEPRYRQERIEAFLGARSDHDLASFAALQGEIETAYALPVRDALRRLLARRPRPADSLEGRALPLLFDWDGVFRTGSPGAALFYFTRRALARRAAEALLGPVVGRRFANGRRALPRIQRLLLDDADPLHGDLEAAGHPLHDLATRAFADAVQQLAARCGAAPEGWSWGRVHRVRLGTALAELPVIGRRFLALDAPFPGDEYSVSPSRPLEIGGRLRAFVGASSRFLCDLSRPDEALFAHSAGPSGDVGSAFYANLSPAWLRFEYFRSALWPADAVPDPLERVVVEPGAAAGSGPRPGPALRRSAPGGEPIDRQA